MTDARHSDAAPASPTVRLADYRAPDFLVDSVHLDFQLDPARTRVKSRLAVRRATGADRDAPLVLDGDGIELMGVTMEGDKFPAHKYEIGPSSLTLRNVPDVFTLEIETVCRPDANKALSGLYISSGMFCTQCEAQGFRRITYFPDRPDVLARYSVRIEADAQRYPVLLSNGNRIGGGALADGRHFAEWGDPHPKPSYLFALVGGDLAAVEDEFVTRSGRRVALKVFVQPENREKCGYTLDSLKRAMRWDEEAFGREYDLDIFMIVAVDHFNFGAMENKGLNIFNSAYVLASPETATDGDYEAIESIVAHEYFHNWSGNRVTCRDWFQLCLKEGFTVFRDQEFSADMRSRAVQRIKDVRQLWSRQFPEDQGPLAHAVRPDHYVAIDNFYTATVYEKGAELCRMLKTLVGAEAFRRGCDLYFDRCDGRAATVEDFVGAIAEAGGRNLDQFWRWYTDAGTPKLRVETHSADISDGSLRVSISQSTPPTPGQPEKPPRQMPIAYAVIGAASRRVLDEGLIELTSPDVERTFGPYTEQPVLSVLRGYSAPVELIRAASLDERLLLLSAEPDLFSRWAVAEKLWRETSLAAASQSGTDKALLDRFADALGDSLAQLDHDPAFAAELLRAPTDAELLLGLDAINPDAIAAGRAHVRKTIGTRLRPQLEAIHQRLRTNAPYSPDAEAAGRRALMNGALSLLVAAGEYEYAQEQAACANNMTDEAAAVSALATADSPARRDVLDRFYAKWRREPLVVKKWLAWRAMAPAKEALGDVAQLLTHEAFDIANPNSVRALIGAFANQNVAGFHRDDGKGYAFLTDRIIEIDRFNPQLAARLTAPFELWRRLEPRRRRLAEEQLTRLTQLAGASPNLAEMASRLKD